MLKLGISTCPNDTFIFYGWLKNRLAENSPPVKAFFGDISTLNEMALANELDVVKVSFFAYSMVTAKYTLLNCGGAVGRGCGPLIIAKKGADLQSIVDSPDTLFSAPGKMTTANLLLSLLNPKSTKRKFIRFDRIIESVVSGRSDAGVIIHESRFTYKEHGLDMVCDLGQWWEDKTGLPLPLGCIIAKKSLGSQVIENIENTIRESLIYARNNPCEAFDFVKLYAKELSDDVMEKHVNLFVNNFSFGYDKEALRAIKLIVSEADKEKSFFNSLTAKKGWGGSD